jgi:hypothetical protein
MSHSKLMQRTNFELVAGSCEVVLSSTRDSQGVTSGQILTICECPLDAFWYTCIVCYAQIAPPAKGSSDFLRAERQTVIAYAT